MWYTIRLGWNDPLTGERTFITGGSLVGSPAFTFGRTPYVSWGTTAVNPDVTDLYSETIKDDKYLYEGEWRDLDIREETIKVRFGDDVKI
jgi:acyl-homoserine lactone acylase PvdQ